MSLLIYYVPLNKLKHSLNQSAKVKFHSFEAWKSRTCIFQILPHLQKKEKEFHELIPNAPGAGALLFLDTKQTM